MRGIGKVQVILGYWGLAGVDCLPGICMGLCHRSGFDLRVLQAAAGIIRDLSSWTGSKQTPCCCCCWVLICAFLFSFLGLFLIIVRRKFLTFYLLMRHPVNLDREIELGRCSFLLLLSCLLNIYCNRERPTNASEHYCTISGKE